MATTAETILGDSNLFSREHSLESGEVIDWHLHPTFDHTTFIFQGRVRVRLRKDGIELERELAPETRESRKVVIYAGWEHRIEALEPSEIECVYAHHTPQARVSQRWTGWPEAYE